jgi:hypothetical protein
MKALLEILGKTIVFNDFKKVALESATSVVESFNSLQLRYAPKRKYYNLLGLERQTRLAVMHWNAVQKAERGVVAEYWSESKARGERRFIKRKELVEHPWKAELVSRAVALKERQGPGRPVHEFEEALEDEQEPTTEQLGDELFELDEEGEEDELL